MCQNQYFADCSFECSLSGISMCEEVYATKTKLQTALSLNSISRLAENPIVHGAPVSMVPRFPLPYPGTVFNIY